MPCKASSRAASPSAPIGSFPDTTSPADAPFSNPSRRSSACRRSVSPTAMALTDTDSPSGEMGDCIRLRICPTSSCLFAIGCTDCSRIDRTPAAPAACCCSYSKANSDPIFTRGPFLPVPSGPVIPLRAARMTEVDIPSVSSMPTARRFSGSSCPAAGTVPNRAIPRSTKAVKQTRYIEAVIQSENLAEAPPPFVQWLSTIP